MQTDSTRSLVSVIIPTIGRESLVEAVASVAAQTYRPVEVIVVYDAPDAVPDEANLRAAAGDCSLVLHRHKERKGGAGARNTGIGLAQGAYVGFLDDDDIYYPSKLETLVHALEQSPDIDAAFGKMRSFDGVRHSTRLAYPAIFSRKTNLLVMNYIHNNASLVRASVLSSLKFYEPLARFQDLQFNAELSYRFKVRFVDEFVAEWRNDVRSDRTTHTGGMEKKKRDASTFRDVLEYLQNVVGVQRSWLVFFQLYLFRQHLALGNFGEALALLLRKDSFLWRPVALLEAIRIRKRMWRGPRANQA